MQSQKNAAQQGPKHHVHHVMERFQELIDHLRSDIGQVDDPQAKALFETSAEVLGGLKNAFQDYEEKTEAAWRAK